MLKAYNDVSAIEIFPSGMLDHFDLMRIVEKRVIRNGEYRLWSDEKNNCPLIWLRVKRIITYC